MAREDISTAAMLYHAVYPGRNFYQQSRYRQELWENGARNLIDQGIVKESRRERI